jgi:hypothetical protein
VTSGLRVRAAQPEPRGIRGQASPWRGPYEDRVVYNAGDVVSAQGSTWITNEGIGSGDIAPPDDPWQLLAAKGDAGTFDGTLQSPNGQYSLSLTNAGALLSDPGGTVKIGASSIDVVGSGGGSVHVTPAGAAVQGSQVTLNGCNAPIARLGDGITGVMAGTVFGQNVTGGSTPRSRGVRFSRGPACMSRTGTARCR